MASSRGHQPAVWSKAITDKAPALSPVDGRGVSEGIARMTTMKQRAESALLRSIGIARKYKPLRGLLNRVAYLLDKGAVQTMTLSPKLPEGLSWRELDRVYSFCRRLLQTQAGWRYGPARVHDVAREGFEALSPYTRLQEKVYCDLGCGTYHPYGIATVMYLNGAASTYSLDLRAGNRQRAAEALADLLCDCCSCPDKWRWSGIDKWEFLGRALRFDIQALREGRLDDGLAELPLQHIVTDIHGPALAEDSIDIMTSRAVLEHFLDFEVAVRRLFALMRKGGIASHHIDLVDHRSYVSSKYHHWSFLAEGDDWSDGLVNRLRSCEIRPYFERAGFEILRYENRIGKMPEGFMQRVAGRFKEMTEEELSVTGVLCVLRKP